MKYQFLLLTIFYASAICCSEEISSSNPFSSDHSSAVEINLKKTAKCIALGCLTTVTTSITTTATLAATGLTKELSTPVYFLCTAGIPSLFICTGAVVGTILDRQNNNEDDSEGAPAIDPGI